MSELVLTSMFAQYRHDEAGTYDVTRSDNQTETQLDLRALDNDLPFNLRNVMAAMRSDLDSIRDAVDVKAGEIGILSVIWFNPGLSQNDLANCLAMKKSHVTQRIKQLEERGLLARRRVEEDRRFNALTLTADGHHLVARVRRLTDSLNAQAMEGVSETDRATFFRVLDRIQANLKP